MFEPLVKEFYKLSKDIKLEVERSSIFNFNHIVQLQVLYL